jgi:hypothetical protein
MSSPPIPPSLEHLATRPFSFYPPIVHIEHNEWLYRKANWSEVLVLNCKTGMEIWISRRYIGAVSRVDDPVLIVGLQKELEYKGGTVWPYQRRVIEMPMAVGAPPLTSQIDDEGRPMAAPVVPMRVESSTDTRIFKLIGGAILVAIVGYLIALNFVRVGELRAKVKFTTKDQTYLELRGRDDYYGVIQRLGKPSLERWQTETGAIQYQALTYPERGYTVILMGGDRKSAVYIGALDDNWNPVHSVELRSGGTTFAMLRGLKRF